MPQRTTAEARRSFDFDFVHVAPRPVLPRLERLDDRVACGVEMLGRVAVRRRITAADVSARAAQAQMHPAPADLQALLAPLGACRNVLDVAMMAASVAH